MNFAVLVRRFRSECKPNNQNHGCSTSWSTDQKTALRLVGIFFTVLIILNVAEIVLTTVEALFQQLEALFLVIEIFTLVVFTVGYIVRLWSCTSDERYARPISGRLLFALTPLVLIDLASIAPTYAALLLSRGVAINFLFIRAFRLLRILRIFKLERYDNSLAIIKRVLIRSARAILTTASWVSLCLS